MRRLILVAVLIAAAPVDGSAQGGWDDPFPAHQVMDNLYFVGTGGLGTFLVTTPEGHILINTDFERTIPLIEESVAALGFDLDDVKIILGSHAHGDHQAADVFLRERTGAQVMIMQEDVAGWQRMNRGDNIPIERILHDGDEARRHVVERTVGKDHAEFIKPRRVYRVEQCHCSSSIIRSKGIWPATAKGKCG